ncbi:MAG: 2-hydroxyglutaryl-CoA dehydratase [Polyangiales bacterium]
MAEATTPTATATDLDIEAELSRFEAAERARLGLSEGKTEHWRDQMVDPHFTAAQRPHTTMLMGGLTMAHDYLVEGVLKGLGYQARALDVPDAASLRAGKEFGNKGQCNPTYFTVGNLVKELCRLRDEEGLSAREIIDGYLFMTAGACGPCRFGMYVTEYRKALRDAGFDGFRVLLFQQTGGFKQATGEELGLVLGPRFFIGLARALFSGDVINLLAYRIRPYEVEAGATDKAIQAVKDEVYQALEQNKSVVLALRRARRHLEAVQVDRTQAKPKVSILGEFWAMTTEGEGNYHLQRFLEAEGAECDIQPLVNTLLYNLWEGRFDTLGRATLRDADGGPYGLKDSDAALKIAGMWIGEYALRTTFAVFACAAGLTRYQLPDMERIAQVGHSHYNNDLRGGEGHMEVAKLILNAEKQKAHMTLSVKPFGCMPSSGVSDGVQSAVTELYPDTIFCAVETSGDGAVNFYSRVQMFLFKARQRAQQEMAETLDSYGLSREALQDFLRQHRYGNALYRAPHQVSGTGADLLHHAAPLIGQGRRARARVHLQRAWGRLRHTAARDLPSLTAHIAAVAPYAPSILRFALEEGLDAVPNPRKLWVDALGRLVRPDAEDTQSIARAEAATQLAPAASEDAKAPLRVVA